MEAYQYSLEKYKGKKYACPQCGQPKKFVRYIDTATGEQIADQVGRCERLDNCSYHFTPKQYFTENNIKNEKRPKFTPQPIEKKPASFIDKSILEASCKGYEQNNFASFLFTLFGHEVASQLFKIYRLGSSNYFIGANVFWQIDYHGNVRTGKIMVYDHKTGKRVKEPTGLFSWVHTALKLPKFELSQCLFGEHLLKNDSQPIAICESEKSAMVASVYLPHFVWLATGGAGGLNESKCQILNKLNRPIMFFPDLSMPAIGKQSTFEKWQDKAKKYLTCKYVFSDLLEKIATDEQRLQGLDLVDYLVNFEPPKPIIKAVEVLEPPQLPTQLIKYVSETIAIEEAPKTSINWRSEVLDLETFFGTYQFRDEPIKLKAGETIMKPANFVENHLQVVKCHSDNIRYWPYLNRLKILREQLKLK